MKSFNIFFSIIASLSVVAGGAMYVAYGVLPHQYYLVTSLGITAAAGAVVYVILSRVVQI
ncbi:MAG: hypothetical protein JRN57_01155 [Nitrososphaerota archaeon]|nr:hypothetical protein [Nitrososphaerota archaeon]MDG7010703.1 hypothetical protein [Nitrososphaerota archaeon]